MLCCASKVGNRQKDTLARLAAFTDKLRASTQQQQQQQQKQQRLAAAEDAAAAAATAAAAEQQWQKEQLAVAEADAAATAAAAADNQNEEGTAAAENGKGADEAYAGKVGVLHVTAELCIPAQDAPSVVTAATSAARTGTFVAPSSAWSCCCMLLRIEQRKSASRSAREAHCGCTPPPPLQVREDIDHRTYMPAAWRVDDYLNQQDEDEDDLASLRQHK